MGYEPVDVLSYIETNQPISFIELKKIYPDFPGTNNVININLSLLISKGLIMTKGSGYVLTEKGIEELRMLDEERKIKIRMNSLQLDLLETQVPLIRNQLNDYQFFKWIPIVISLFSIMISILTMVCSH